MQEQVTAWFKGVQDLEFWKPLHGSPLSFGGLVSTARNSANAAATGADEGVRPNPFDSYRGRPGASPDPSAVTREFGGVVWVEGSSIPPPPVLAPVVEAALGATLAKVTSLEPRVRVNGGCMEVASAASTSFHFEVGLDSGSSQPLLACLRAEAACRGAECLLPELVRLLEERVPEFDGRASTPPGHRERSFSPTADNLAKNPELRDRVMRDAIPLSSSAGKRLSGIDRAASVAGDIFRTSAPTLQATPEARRSWGTPQLRAQV
uniref:Uncharacterized protein n=1 Tax=Alexandrium andersonii TaxID=327968 RepID=A0A7S2C1V1_9DINO|mmetsp:Transcript_32917/g.74951  ORF Transcript_32917/g.74951 Transcript_32917/m.74951 type:complete len:264 (-) Transcript_32917:74-865(-)